MIKKVNIVLFFAIISQVIFWNQSYNVKYERLREKIDFLVSGTQAECLKQS